MEEGKNNKKFSSIGKTVIAVSLTLAGIIAMTNLGVYTWARYHSEDSGKGVATVSSDFFFQSNILKTVKDITWSYGGVITEDEALDEMHSFEHIYGASDWTATTPCVFNIEMYNYENTLRYNADTIKYTLYVKMLPSEDTEYNEADSYEFIQYSDDHMQELNRYDIAGGELLKIENITLAGDEPNKNYFSLLVNPANPDDYVPISIIVYAVITSPDYIDVPSYYLGAIFSPQAEALSFSVSGRFDVESEIDAGNDWLDALNDLSGYIYTVESSGEADAEHDVILYWNGDLLDFDLHNSYYTEQTILDGDKKYKERKPIEYDGFVARGKVGESDDEKIKESYTDYLIYHTAANRSSSFVFYRGEKWDTSGLNLDENDEVVLQPSTYDNFKGLAAVGLY